MTGTYDEYLVVHVGKTEGGFAKRFFMLVDVLSKRRPTCVKGPVSTNSWQSQEGGFCDDSCCNFRVKTLLEHLDRKTKPVGNGVSCQGVEDARSGHSEHFPGDSGNRHVKGPHVGAELGPTYGILYTLTSRR
ncbi:MAG: hypothetical protein JW955_09845, partial [Sedimentisphaerales bacterium]|nr:hypothetical protein [Sedimentisphaerales bacterium]